MSKSANTQAITARVFHAADARAFDFEERCHITEWLNSDADEAVSIARACVEPGVTTRLHRLNGIIERYLILSGQGEAEIEGLAPCVLGPGDVILIPAGAEQRIRNHGDTELVFLAICTPRFTPAAYEDTDPDPL